MQPTNRTTTYGHMREMLNEQQWRQYLALEAEERGSVMQVAQEAGVAHTTIRRGVREREAGAGYRPGDRQRKEGGGRRPAIAKDTSLQADLESLIDPKGDPMSLLKWTTKSVAHLTKTLQHMGHDVADTTVRRLLPALGYSLRANKKTIEGVSHPDRDAQFAHSKQTCAEFAQQGGPIISVDCKKKELLGQFKNNGTEWQAKGTQTRVNA